MRRCSTSPPAAFMLYWPIGGLGSIYRLPSLFFGEPLIHLSPAKTMQANPEIVFGNLVIGQLLGINAWKLRGRPHTIHANRSTWRGERSVLSRRDDVPLVSSAIVV